MQEEENEQFNLEVDITDVDTSFPAFSIGDHLVKIAKATVVPFSKKPEHAGKKSLQLLVTNAEDCLGHSGDTFGPGKLSAFHRLNLFQSDNENARDFRVELAKLSDAAFGERRAVNNEFFASLAGAEITVRVAAAKDTSFGPTEIKGLKT